MAEARNIGKVSSAFELQTKGDKTSASYAEQRVLVLPASLDRFGMAFLRLHTDLIKTGKVSSFRSIEDGMSVRCYVLPMHIRKWSRSMYYQQERIAS